MNAVKMKLSNRALYYHIAGWIVFFLLHYFFFSAYEVKINLWFQISFWITNIILFYLNYLVLIPLLLFRKRIALYLFAFLTVLAFFYFGQNWLMDKQFMASRETRITEFEMNRPKAPFPELKQSEPYRPIGPPPGRRANGMALYNVLLFLFAGTAIRVMSRFDVEEKLKKDAENRKALDELKLLKQQVNPHFLFNSLNSIYSLANKKSDLTTEAVLKLSGTLRYMLYDVNQQVVYLNKEIEHIRNFIELQKFRLTEDTEIIFNVSGETDKFLIEPLLLIPFVENAFKFGVDNRRRSFIHINVKVEQSELKFEVKNRVVNKPGTDDEERTGGIGLSNVKRRLEILYPDRHELRLIEELDVFIVYLGIKLRK
jgi:two-component system, LytTR family, sensor kinase